MLNGYVFNKKSILTKFDTAPTSGSDNLVTSGSIKEFVDGQTEILQTQITEIQGKFVELPVYDGKYRLTCSVEEGEPVVYWEEIDPQPVIPKYLTFSCEEPFVLSTKNGLFNDGTLEYSLDAETWVEWDGSDITSTNNAIYLRGVSNTTFYNVDEDEATILAGTLVSQEPSNNKIMCSGNIESILNHVDVERGRHPEMGESCFYKLFIDFYLLGSSPVLPAMTLTDDCYSSMFRGCTSLTSAPELPATTLGVQCYKNMFDGCTSLTAAPSLPATTLEVGCYRDMFSNCTSLTETPELPSTELADYCYSYMFCNCTELITMPELPATSLTDYCYTSMFSGCSNIQVSETQTSEYTEPYRIPSEGTGETGQDSLLDMIAETGGTFTDTPQINTTYYLHTGPALDNNLVDFALVDFAIID